MTPVCRKSATGANSRAKPKKKPFKNRSKLEVVVETRLSPALAWMYPYLHKAKRMMPNLVMPKKVRSYRPGTGKIMRVMGNAYSHNKTVIIATHNQLTYMDRKGELRVKKIVRIPQAQMLDTLAHEVAHLRYPDHGYEHDEFTRAIFKTFGLKEKCPHCKGTGKIQMEGRY